MSRYPGTLLGTDDPERVRNAFLLATTARGAGHEVSTFLLGAGVDASDLDRKTFDPRDMTPT